MISRLLVANRGEIASRVFATCRRLGIGTVAVHSDADADLPFVGEADVAVRLPGHAAGETYLRVDLLLEAARRSGADAIHPGYGFLSENADFARAVIGAGLTWVGPAPESIESMGSKVAAKGLMVAAGVPVLGNVTAQGATTSDLPLLVKASAGGGGRGMRVVRELADLPGEIEKARAEAAAAFGDGTIFVEPYVERGRHVEVQVVGHPGGVLVLGERDCSIQRRHQKVVEESPAPGLSQATRRALHAAAASAAAAVDYRGAGTVEFLLDPATERFFFLEMNTRLQVEHPVTELVHGVDLVELQLAVAEGRDLDPHAIGTDYGHAIEVRLYAEDPAADWQPQAGTLTRFEVPGVAGEFDLLNRPGIRLDSGVVTGSEVSTFYDPMLAKVIAWAPTREQAARRLADALAKARIHGVVTNRDLLVDVLRDEAFLAGEVDTQFLTDRPGPATAPDEGAAVAATYLLVRARAAARTVQRGIPAGWRHVGREPSVVSWRDGAREVAVAWSGGRDGLTFPGVDAEVLAEGPDWVRLRRAEGTATYRVALTGPSGPGGETADVDSPRGHVRLTRVPRFTDPAAAVARGSLLAPMPGTVLSVAVEVGAHVAAGQGVLVLEAMKMQHTVSAPHAGTLTRLGVSAGAQVAAGEVLAVVQEQTVQEQTTEEQA